MADRNTSIRASQLRNGTVTDKDIQDDSLTGVKFVDVTISGGKIADGAISESKLDMANSPVDGYYLKYTTASGMDWSAGGGGVSDHGSLTGLADDDHTQYFLVDGTKALTGNVTLPSTTTSTTGVIYKGADRFIHDFHHPIGGGAVPIGLNTFAGVNAGNFTMGSTATSTAHGSNNTGVGHSVLIANTTGYQNAAFGLQALVTNTTGYKNSAVGVNALNANTSGYHNSAVGWNVLLNVTEGHDNTAIGYNTGLGITTGDYNTIIGANVTGLASDLSNTVIIADGQGNQRMYIDSSGNILPAASGTQDIGSVSLPWKDLYLTGDSLYMDGIKVLSISDGSLKVASGDLEVDEIRAIDSSGLSLKDDAGNLAIFIDDGGKVGIGGVTNPSSSLDLKTALGVWNAAETRGTVQSPKAEYSDWWYYNGSGWTIPLAMSDLKANMSVDFMDGWVGIANTKTNSLEATGIGVGVSGPTEKLEVGTDTDVSAIIGRAHIGYDGTGADQAMFSHVDTATANNYSIKSTNLGATMINVASGQSIYFRVNNSTVATLSASELLMSGTVRLATDEVRARGVVGLHLKDDSGISGIFIEDGGNVGMGTTTPSGKLHVSGSHIFTNMGYGFMSYDTEGNLAGMYVNTDDSLRLITNATPRLTISEAGNIDITGTLQLPNGTSINEFSTDTTLSGDSDNAVPTEKAVKTYVDSATGNSSGCRVYRSTTQSITQNTWTKVEFDTEVYDNQSEFDNATNYRFTAKAAGVYNVTSVVTLDNLPDTYTALIAIYLNGTIAFYGTSYGVGAITDAKSVVTLPLKLAVGDYVEIHIFQNSTGALNIIAGGAFSYLAVQRITAASEHGSAHENSSYAKVSDVKSSGNAGGFTAGAWQTRVLNTEDSDPDGICSLASNQITLAAGTYECVISAPGYKVDQHTIRLRNVTDSSDVLLGTANFCDDGDNTQTRALLSGRFTIAASKALEVQHRCQTTCATYGLGVGHGFGDCVFCVAEFWKISEDGSGSGSGFSSRVSASLSANQTGVVHATWTKVELNTEQFDGLGEFNTSTHLFTPNTNGYYQINACIGHEGMGDADTVQTAIYVNSARVAHASIDTGGTSSPGIPISKLVYLTTSDTVSLWGRHTLGSNGAFDAGVSETYLTIHRVS